MATTTTQAWTATDLGPRQLKSFQDAVKAFNWKGRSYIRITGVYGNPASEHRSELTPFHGTVCDAYAAAEKDIGEQFGWTVSKKALAAVLAAYGLAMKTPLPVQDERRQPDVEAKRLQEQAARQAEMDAARERDEQLKAAIRNKAPSWAAAVIVAEYNEDQSDSMTDYFSHKTTRKVAIGWRKGAREDFRQLRAAAATFPETAHLGTGCDVHTVLILADSPHGRHEAWRDDSYATRRFKTREEAEAAIAAADADTFPHGHDIHCESVEHRDNWSFGGGNYLSAGISRHSSGWTVRSYNISNLPAAEDHLPDPKAVIERPIAPVSSTDGVVLTENMQRQSIEIRFPAKPDADVLASLKSAGWKWSRFSKCWYAKASGAARAFANNLAQQDVPASAATEPQAAPTQPSATPKTERLRKSAESLTAKIEHATRDMTQNPTPKRMKEFQSRLIDGNNMLRTQKALLALADAHEAGTCPAILADLKSVSEIGPLVRHGTDSTGYYDIRSTGKYVCQTPQAVALQQLMENAKTEADRVREAEAARKAAIDAKVNALRFSDIDGFFPTPLGIARQLVAEARIQPNMEILEPSAGIGSIADVIREAEPTARVTVCERMYSLREILEMKGYSVTRENDFLEIKGSFDRIIMNPPFEHGGDTDHVRHAYGLLRDGGWLVAIMSTGPWHRSDKRSAAFREWLSERHHYECPLPGDAFNAPDAFRRTSVATKIVVIAKPVSE